MILKAVLFDLIGTTVKEKDPDAMNNCFVKSFTDNKFKVSKDIVISNRGRSKPEIIYAVSEYYGIENSYSGKISDSFKVNFAGNIDNFIPNDGAVELMKYLKEKNIKTGLGTGLPKDLFDMILINLSWDNKLFDYISTADEAGGGRPDPAMIFDMMNKLGISEKDQFLKVGDTVADILEGKNAGVKTAVILSGTQSKEMLQEENPDFMISSLIEIQKLLD